MPVPQAFLPVLFLYDNFTASRHNCHLLTSDVRALGAGLHMFQMGNKRRKQMKSSTKDRIKGKLHEMKGKAKETAGQVASNPNLEAEGQSEKLAGKVQRKIGQIEKVFEK
jgi:uncharacterized protein YjbJ (UPF0337 family)